jgi:uncharacterized membrane protein
VLKTETPEEIDVYVARIDPSGTITWALSATGPGLDGRSIPDVGSIGGIAVDDQGNVWVVGSIDGTVRFGDQTVTTSETRAFVWFIPQPDY